MTAGPSSPAHVRVGEYDCYSLPDGFFRLDGGAMFGVAPKALWGRFYEADADNRIRLACRQLALSERPIDEIAESLGFPDRYYFSRAFKRHMGCGPATFRKGGGGREN